MIKELIESLDNLIPKYRRFFKISNMKTKESDLCMQIVQFMYTDILAILEPYMIYDNLVEKVLSWWDEVYPADVFTGVSGNDDAIKVGEIRELLDKIKAMSERGKI